MALHIRTGVYEQTAQTQDLHYLPAIPSTFFNIHFGFKSPQWPNILGQESMCKQHRPRLSGSTLFAIPIIFIFILCIYIIKMSLHIKCMHKQGIPKPAPSAISPIAMLLHHHNGPLYWDRSCIYYQNGPCIGTEVYAQTVQTQT